MNLNTCWDVSQKIVKTKYYKLFLTGLILTVIVTGTISFIAWSQEKLRPMLLMGMAINALHDNPMDFNVTIHEEGKDYMLQFHGNLFQNVMTGTLLDYDLEIIKRNSYHVFVKDKKDNLWKNSSELGLEALSGFLITPKDIIISLKPYMGYAKFTDELSKNEYQEISIYLASHELKETDLMKQFKNLNGPLSLQIIICFADNPNNMYAEKLKLTFYDELSEKPVLERTYFLKPIPRA